MSNVSLTVKPTNIDVTMNWKVCPKCGRPVDPNWSFCPWCGQALG